ncbi:acetylglutamate kinase [Marinisporobacter balticus]|uniref:Acetylglutamate kinase n=1 Tax=Marinisporobacter balticus TaxID=2018667 RepID=A0A4R2KC17_9FIRM|nr:acetylglutamate kinase [Marinisporobacter balticus]TCO71061.1 N-acetylglutamate kinase [Marinisporobacter balticus]
MDHQKIAILIEALPYIKKFRGKTFVIKYGGSIMKNMDAKKALIEDVVLLKLVGIHVVIVHGGGPNISNWLNKLDIETTFVKGLRVTDESVMEVVEMVLSGKVNKGITSDLCKHGIDAVGISGRDNQLIAAKKKYIYEEKEKIDIGYVGEVVSVNTKLLDDLLQNGYLPVISPIGCDQEGNIYNINADYVASAISAVLNAEKLILLTDVEGLYRDIKDTSSFISSIEVEEIKKCIKEEVILGGMIPKMECCIEAIERGTKNVHLIDGRKEHSLLLEIFTNEGMGTMIKGGEKNEQA